MDLTTQKVIQLKTRTLPIAKSSHRSNTWHAVDVHDAPLCTPNTDYAWARSAAGLPTCQACINILHSL